MRWKKCGAPSSTTRPGKPDLHLIAIGRLRDGPEAALFQRYVARIRGGLTVVELSPAGAGAQARARENAALRAALPPRAYAVALDPSGQAPDSTGFAALLEGWRGRQEALYFIIGGAQGLDPETLARADARLSLGPMTWPHLLSRALLAEQLYRAQAIAFNHPYHSE